MYAKLNEDGTLSTISGRLIKVSGRAITNPTPELLRSSGYKPLVPDEPPEIPGEVHNAYYEETEDEIRLVFEKEEQ